MSNIIYVIFVKEGCIFCQKTEKLLEEKNIKYYKKILGKDFTEIWFREEFGKNSTYPRIFKINSKNNHRFLIGGYDQLKKILE